MDRPLIIGTRGSDLALAQATRTEQELAQRFPSLTWRREIIKTIGDRRTDIPLAQVALATGGVIDKGVFTKELEIALDQQLIDVAVHSLKDMPTELDPDYELIAVLERAPVADLLLSLTPGGLDALPHGAKVGTSSVRRREMLRHLRPDLSICDLRGNVPTRIQKLADSGEYDAIVLAEAGLTRLNYASDHFDCAGKRIYLHPFDPAIFLPAAGQGAIALEIRKGDENCAQWLRPLNHLPTWRRIEAEREFLRLLQAGCHTPVGISSEINQDCLYLQAIVFDEDGSAPPKRASISGPADQGLSLAHQLYHSLQ